MAGGTRLVLISLGLTFVAGIFIGVDLSNGDAGFAYFLGWVIAAIAATLWFIGCIAMGVRIGQRDAQG